MRLMLLMSLTGRHRKVTDRAEFSPEMPEIRPIGRLARPPLAGARENVFYCDRSA